MEWTPEQCNRPMAGRPPTTSAMLLVVCTSALAGGCRMCPDPGHDEMAGAAPITTPSANGVRQAGTTPRAVHPAGEHKAVRAKSGTVLHGPLYFEDPLEEFGSDDGRFAVTREDWHAFWLTGIRFQINALLYPFSFLDTPPWVTMASDGRPGGKRGRPTHDAAPLPRPAPAGPHY